jgi:hypothetical protein
MFDQIHYKGGFFSTFHNLLFKDFKTKLRFRTSNLLHAKANFYGRFKQKIPSLVQHLHTCSFSVKNSNLYYAHHIASFPEMFGKVENRNVQFTKVLKNFSR